MSLLPTIDKNLKSFFLKIFVIIICWKLLYHFVLIPIRIPDNFLTNTITAGVAWLSSLLNIMGSDVSWTKHPFNVISADGITLNGQCIFLVDDTCNGLEIMLIYTGIIAILPKYALSRRLLFIVAGLIALIICNIGRCTALLWIYTYHKPIFDFNHHYVFTFVMYIIIFMGWMLFTKKQVEDEVQ